MASSVSTARRRGQGHATPAQHPPAATIRRVVAAIAVVVTAVATLAVAAPGPAGAATFVPYDGPSWMSRVKIVGDSFVYTTQPEIKAAVRSLWWRDATFSFPGVRVDTMRDQVRAMASDAPEAFVVSLGALDSLALRQGVYDWNHQVAQINGMLDDLTRARVGCVVWVGPNQNFDGGWLDFWATRINDEVRSQLSRRGLGVFGDWTARAAGHPEYFLADGSHFTPSGKAAFSSLIADRLRDCAGNPRGSLDGVHPGLGSLRIAGWAHDPDTPGPVDVHVYVDGQFRGAHRADRARPDVAAANAYLGPNHGYDITVPVQGGTRTACVFGINVGPYGYKHTLLGCRSARVPDSPMGSIDSVSGGVGRVRVSGWTIDPDTPNPIDVHVYVDGRFGGSAKADSSRPDVGALFPSHGANHGYSVTLTGYERGNHQVCVWGINAPGTPGVNIRLGCRTVFVPYGSTPIGSFDFASAAGPSNVRVAGWAIDADTSAPTDVHVYVDWSFAGSFVADRFRPDVGAAHPAYGNNHGFDTVIGSLPRGSRDVCVFAINVAGTPGDNRFLGCKRVSVT
jgi:hypothetical protein